MKEASTVTIRPATGPKAKAAIRMGTSAGSYSRKDTTGIRGTWTAHTSTTEMAASMASTTSLLSRSFFKTKTSYEMM